MPHQCTNCGRTFPDGSKEMLSGCPNCGGNKFQFAPSSGATAAGGASEPDAGAGGERTDAASSGSDEPDANGVASRAAETVRGWVSSSSSDESAGTSTNATAANAATTDARSGSTTAESTARVREAETRSSSSEPGTEPATERDGPSENGEFSEWPDSARRPEDRSSATTRSAADDRPASTPDTEANARPEARSSSGIEVSTPAESEDSAQASARSEVVPTDDLPADAGRNDGTGAVTDVGETTGVGAGDGSDQPPNEGRVVSEPSGEQPSIEDLRAELNEQFESIKIVRPGQYELNLMELYNRDEYIISLQEDGRYVIDVPESWHDGADE